MRSRLMSLITIVALGLLFSVVAFGQTQSKPQQPSAGKAAGKFDPHDLSGFWEGPPPGERPAEDARPAFTPAGKEAMSKRMPVYISRGGRG